MMQIKAAFVNDASLTSLLLTSQTLEREVWKDGLRDGWGGRDVRG